MAGHEIDSNVIRPLHTFLVVTMVMMSQLPTMTSSTERYHVQYRVYVEPSAFNIWKGMTGKSSFDDYKAEINSYFVEMQRIYDGLKEFDTVAITAEIESLVLLKKDVIRDTYNPNDIQGLETFKDSLSSDWASQPYDMAILFTGRNLGGVRKGFAYINKVCDVRSVGILKQAKTEEMYFILTHEIGHTLGSEHDSDRYSDQPCYDRSGRVMNPKTHIYSPNKYSFSYCSNGYLTDRLADTTRSPYRRNCLKDGNQTITGKRLGDLVSADELCRRDNKGAEFVMRSYYQKNKRNMDNICNSIQCARGGGDYYSLPSLPGMKCGKNKVCNRGVCEESFDGSPFVLDSCPFGDQPLVGDKRDKTCADIDPSECPKYATECCYTCAKNNRVFSMSGDEVCRELAGNKFVMLRTYTSFGDELCSRMRCYASHDGVTFDKKTVTAPDGMACGTNKRCTSGKCVTTQHGDPTISDRCPFGDQDLTSLGYGGTCQEYAKDRCQSWGGLCCQSCHGK